MLVFELRRGRSGYAELIVRIGSGNDVGLYWYRVEDLMSKEIYF